MQSKPFSQLLLISALLVGPAISAQNTRAFNQNASRSNHTRLQATAPQDGPIVQFSGGHAKSLPDGATGNFMPSATIGYFKSRLGASIEIGQSPMDPDFDLENYTAGLHGFTTTTLRPAKSSWFAAVGPVYRQPLPGNMQLQTGLMAGVRKNSFTGFTVTDNSSGQVIADYNNAQKTNLNEQQLQLLIKPTIRLEWFPAKSFVGLHIYASGLMAPSEQSVTAYYRDLSRVNYDVPQQELRAQVLGAPVVSREITTPKTILSFGAGISLRLPSRKNSPQKNAGGCGPVTQKITRPDGVVEERSFGCAEDAARFQQQMDSVNNPTQRTAPQNNNTIRSNRGELKSMLILADTDGDGVYETDITRQMTDDIHVDENDKITPSQKAGISTSRSNVRTRQSLQPVGNGLSVGEGTLELNGKTVAYQAVYKVRHDTVKNSIGNIR